jgi:hypothetical protein
LPPVCWVLGALFMGLKRSKHEADRSLPSHLKVNNMWSFTSMPPVFEFCCVLVWANFTILHFLTQFYFNFTMTVISTTILCFGSLKNMRIQHQHRVSTRCNNKPLDLLKICRYINSICPKI